MSDLKSLIDYQQQRGAGWDIVDEALATYDEWMRCDDYEFHEILKKIMGRMQERRDLYYVDQQQGETK
jgi:hypothetical protein